MWQDLKFAARMLGKSPGFAFVAILTLALGIGANTAIFSAVNGILLRPLPYAHPAQLVSISGYRRFSEGIVGMTDFSVNVWESVRRQTPAFEAMALYQNQSDATLTGEAIPEVIPDARVSSDFFPLLGARPLLGRPILAGDTRPGATPVAVVSYALWRTTWGGDPRIIGREVTLDGQRYTIVGVMPPECEFPFYSGQIGIWLPMIVQPEKADQKESAALAVARLKPGITIDAANAELKTVSARLNGDFKGFLKGGYFNAQPLKPRFGDLDNELLILLGAVGFVLLIACVNVSGLLLARGWGRQKEVAIREALGASRWRIVRQFLVESVLLAVAAGIAGMLLSVAGVGVLRAITPADAPEHGQFLLDANVMWFTLAVSLLTGVLFGLAPAMQASARRIGAALKESLGGSPGGSASKGTRRIRNVLAVVEVALAVVLVIGATLTARSFEKLTEVNLGFRTDHILTMRANFEKSICDRTSKDKLPGCRATVDEALRKIRAIPGVETAAVTSTLPLESWSVTTNLQIEGETKELSLATGEVIADRLVSPGYLQTMGIRLLSGREFDDNDVAGGNRVVIVDQTFARKYLGSRPLGQRISNKKDAEGRPGWMQVVGVVSDAHDNAVEDVPRAEIYIPFAQAPYFQGAIFIARSAESPTALAPAVKRAIWAVDKNAPITDLASMDQVVAGSVAEPKFQAMLLGAFGALGLFLAMVGIYGVISYGVTQRTREIGVRMALGAQRRDVLRMVIAEGMTLAAAGVALGLGAAVALARFLRSMLFGIKPTDPATFAGVAILLATIALFACYIPARRAMRVDPMDALRYE